MVHWGSVECDPPTPTDETDAAWRAQLIDLSGPVGLSKITEDNVEEWMWRILFLQQMLHEDCGVLHWSDGKGGRRSESITIHILRRWVGLWTNWSNMTRAKFTKHYVDRMHQRIDGAVREQANGKPAPTRVKVKRRVKNGANT